MFEPDVVDAAVDVLAELAGAGRALELGIGTGRIALPLARRGVPVHGIDLSRAMVARLRDKPGGDAIGVTIGDFATTRRGRGVLRRVPGLQHDHESDHAGAQVACFRNVAAHLEPGGCFVIEVMVPGAAQAAGRAERRTVPRQPDPVGVRPLRRRHPGDELELHRGRRRPRRVQVDPLPVRVAGRARPDGPARRAAPARAMGRVDPASLHQARAASTSRSGRNPSADCPPGPPRGNLSHSGGTVST